MKCAYSTGTKDVHVPEKVAKALEGLDIDGGSYRKARTDIVAYVEWVNDEERDFPTDNTAEEHARFIHRYFTYLKDEGYARETVKGRWTWITRLYQELSSPFLNEYAFLDENPFTLLEEREGKERKHYLPSESEVSQEKRQYYVDKEELETLCENVGAPAFRNEVLLRLAFYTGLRCSEMAELKLRNINLEENLLEGFWVPKTAKRRSLWIPDTLVWFLDGYLNGGYRAAYSYAEESDYVFLTNKAPQMHRQTPNKVIKRAGENAGLQEVIGTTQKGNDRYKITAHALRRGHGMHLWQQGKDIALISRRLGHASISQTETYLPIQIEESKEALADVTF